MRLVQGYVNDKQIFHQHSNARYISKLLNSTVNILKTIIIIKLPKHIVYKLLDHTVEIIMNITRLTEDTYFSLPCENLERGKKRSDGL